MEPPMQDPRPVSSNQEFAEFRKDLAAYKKKTWWTVRILVVIAFLISCGVPVIICGIMFLVTKTDPPSTGIGEIMLPIGCVSLFGGALVFCICRNKIATKRQYQGILGRRGLDPERNTHFNPERFRQEEEPRSSGRAVRGIAPQSERPRRGNSARSSDDTPPPPDYAVIEDL
uniref:Probable S-adenosylmethionine-dependent methyltransferase CRG1 n=1 Tax=Phallusia mammillata TaxID=59560 RepID=A0A6F9DAS7_9ASCI|nr:probable S-adenosylmethionine-dependent methyltransferase CRG1 [Phallusia mammillata]